ncbi:DUF6691 family protein [Novosphingobium sp.]|uniref:DUF6691 family protein n=1 Tax=Novosphingobium sp. TaxID=1874826 RepID=UPI001EB2AB57|nr:DUF6691 family protein [Novosphingobium sp.]MBK9011130.1 hypothetical protein [Novosphingobium sp.]
MRILIALVSGLLFGIGLALSGMASPDKVIGFLDVAGNWDPSLAFVMGGALLVATPLYLLAGRRGVALCGDTLGEPEQTLVDRRLIGGSVLFGVGWGLVGLCPGPALLDLFAQPLSAGLFCAAMLGGLLLSRRD